MPSTGTTKEWEARELQTLNFFAVGTTRYGEGNQNTDCLVSAAGQMLLRADHENGEVRVWLRSERVVSGENGLPGSAGRRFEEVRSRGDRCKCHGPDGGSTNWLAASAAMATSGHFVQA